MDTLNKIFKKTVIGNCPKFSILGFRFGPTIIVKIEVTYQSGQFTSNILSNNCSTYKDVFNWLIVKTQNEILADIEFQIKHKNLLKELEAKKQEVFKKRCETPIPNVLSKQFDELTNRMKKKEKSDGTEDYTKYFGDTTKILNRRTIK